MNLRDLAKELGLSQTTVSRALGGYPEVGAKTRARVQEAAKRLNYSPNAKARSLATGRAMAIGHVIPVSSQHELSNPIFGDFVAGASQVYSAKGYDMLLSRVAEDDEERAYRRLKAERRVDGVILQTPHHNDRRIQILNEIGLPFVVHGRATGVTAPHSWVDMNNVQSFQQATDLLLDLGHRRIALLNGLESMDFASRRREGYETALKARGITPEADLMRSAEMTESYGFRATRELLALDNPPTAILAASQMIAFGVRHSIENVGLTMGRDISVVTHDDMISYLSDESDRPVFTATRSSVQEAGRICAQVLLDQLNNPQTEPQEVLLKSQLVLGTSTGPCPT